MHAYKAKLDLFLGRSKQARRAKKLLACVHNGFQKFSLVVRWMHSKVGFTSSPFPFSFFFSLPWEPSGLWSAVDEKERRRKRDVIYFRLHPLTSLVYA